MIDLGHVRMRFVEAGEDFVFGRDAQAVDITPRGGSKAWLWGLLGLVVVIGGIGIYVATSGGEDDKTGTTESAGVLPDDGDKKNDSLVKDGVVADTAGDVADDSAGVDPQDMQAKAALEEAREAIAKESWQDAEAAAKRVLAIEADNEAAKKIEAQAQRELENEVKYNKFLKAVKDGDNAKVATLFEDIDHDSIYRDRARTDHDALKKAYIDDAENRARKLAARGKCADVKRIADAADAVWADAGRAVTAIEHRCRDDRTAKDDKKDDVKKDVVKDEKKDVVKDDTKDDTTDASSGKTTTELIAEAQTAAKAHQFAKALRLCEDALKKSRGHQQAVMVCAIAACNLKNVSKAKKYIGQLQNADRKQMARQICLRNSVKL